MTDILDRIKNYVVGQQGYGAGFLRTAVLSSAQQESAKWYKKKRPVDDEADKAFVAWYVGEVWKVPRMVTYLDGIGLKHEDIEQACWSGVYQAKDDLSKPQPEPVVKVGRNELCPCGSGKKYKKCCGR